MSSINPLLLIGPVVGTLVAVLASRLAVKQLVSSVKQQGSDIEIKLGDRTVRIRSKGDHSDLSKAIEDEISKQ
jgi:hypothetical protein